MHAEVTTLPSVKGPFTPSSAQCSQGASKMAPSLPPSVSAHQGLLPVVAESLEVLENFKGTIICHTVAVDFQDALACTEPGSHSLGAWGTGALET